jgi:hypothetical protein
VRFLSGLWDSPTTPIRGHAHKRALRPQFPALRVLCPQLFNKLQWTIFVQRLKDSTTVPEIFDGTEPRMSDEHLHTQLPNSYGTGSMVFLGEDYPKAIRCWDLPSDSVMADGQQHAALAQDGEMYTHISAWGTRVDFAVGHSLQAHATPCKHMHFGRNPTGRLRDRLRRGCCDLPIDEVEYTDSEALLIVSDSSASWSCSPP